MNTENKKNTTMKRLFSIVVLTTLLALLAACGKESTPTANPGPASSTAQDLSGFAYAFPFPLVREQGVWRLGFPILAMGTEPGCPFWADLGR